MTNREKCAISLDRKNIARETGSLHRFLYTLLSASLPLEERKRILSGEYGIRMEHELEKEVEGMCNLSDAIEAEGIRKGMRKGIRKGRKAGEKSGRRVGRKEGESKMSRLVLALLQSGREDLIGRVAEDPALRDRMYREYRI